MMLKLNRLEVMDVALLVFYDLSRACCKYIVCSCDFLLELGGLPLFYNRLTFTGYGHINVQSETRHLP